MAEAAKFVKEMTIGQALAVHPNAGMVFAGYHLGGCSHCSVSEAETIEEVCMGYGVPVDQILADLNSLLQPAPQAAAQPATQHAK